MKPNWHLVLVAIACLAVGRSMAQDPNRVPFTPQQLQQMQQMLSKSTVPGQEPWMMSGYDMVQTNDILDIKARLSETNKHWESTDATVVIQGKEQSASDARSAVWNSILSVIVTALIGDRIYIKKKEEAP